jgi:hypothetical protein
MAEHAELVFSGGPVYTADADRHRVVRATAPDGRPASAVAVTHGRIAVVADADDGQIADLTGPATQVVDLPAALITSAAASAPSTCLLRQVGARRNPSPHNETGRQRPRRTAPRPPRRLGHYHRM